MATGRGANLADESQQITVHEGRSQVMIERIEGLPENVIGLRASGSVSRSDYQTMVKPAIDAGLKQAPKLRMLFQVGPDFEKFEAGAIAADAGTGLRHPFSWERVALVTDVDWIARSANLFGFLMPGDFEVFSNADLDKAKEWVAN